ncbi:hypothetical protein FVR03_12055 [Pontibacter qinzhouensis]|uniref:Uncharacterized protein n=1 Tax=Pontibacter qinzhouensis TaxID=2603253 RepID=A0A5C8K541_9BACT|nr:hypothetical protein [Pontibacter qinzhouensis]TXK45747.1 hypothetical protein FVR03_12055 [Pontibacter qinzhouensis]
MKSEESKPASEVEKEGENVTAGPGKENAAGNPEKAAEESSDYPGSDKADLDEVNKKERMTGYNELPEQEKVGE